MNTLVSSDPQTAIQKGSKSFYLASLFFSERTKYDCWVLYRWCRYCDDRIDNGGTKADLEELKSLTRMALKGLPVPDEFQAVGEICLKYSIPEKYLFDLLSGFEKDTFGIHIHDQKDLEEYAYQVAGVVGMMMSHIMKANLPKASGAAQSMGNAMQLTNIARDIREDFLKDRIYLPTTWLADEDINVGQLIDSSQREKLFRVVKRLLARAQELYREGHSGLNDLPFRSAVAVSIASSIYSAIGKKILKRGSNSLDSRVYVSLPEKLWFVIEGLGRVLMQLPGRLSRRRLINDVQSNI